MPHNNYRTEHDLIGAIKVPLDVMYGAQTQRAVELYPLNGEKPLSSYPELIIAMLQVKEAATRTNMATGELDETLSQAILGAIRYLQDDLPAEQFPVHAFHGGGGISSNMNVNEVIANIANRDSFGNAFGSYTPIHPNDHINLNNSTADALTTACHLAILKKWQGLEHSLSNLAQTFDQQGQKWRKVLKISRTCLQDAVEISYEQFFSGYSALITRNMQRLKLDVEQLYSVNLGGNIIGRRGDCSDAFFDNSMDILNQVMASNSFKRSENLFDSSQNHDDMVAIAGRIDLLSRGLIKVAKDFRLMCSGPETGFGEITLPAVQPGSSAMPGKINPTIPEFLVQCCLQTCGRCCSVQMTQDHGELDFNVWQAIVINNVLDAMSCLENGITVFTEHCLAGVQPNLQRNEDNINTLIPSLIRLKNAKGYSFASRIYKESGGDIEAIRKYLQD
jgi:aspartate ammonia-lyase